MFRRIVGLAGLCVVGVACNSPTAPGEEGSLPLRTVAKATVANHAVQGLRVVVRDPGRWEAIWTEIWGESAPSLPDVDFEREMIVVASGSLVCFADVKIESVQQAGAGIHVGLADSGPSSTCLCASPETTFHAVRTRRIEGAVEFSARQIPPTCP